MMHYISSRCWRLVHCLPAFYQHLAAYCGVDILPTGDRVIKPGELDLPVTPWHCSRQRTPMGSTREGRARLLWWFV
jgi:hypothetical protein